MVARTKIIIPLVLPVQELMWTLGLVKYGIYCCNGENASWIIQNIPDERVRGVTRESVNIVSEYR